MKFNIESDGNVTYLAVQSEKLDSKIAPDLKSQFIMLANDESGGHLVVDLGNITFADSSGLSALLLANRLFRETGKKLVLCNLSDRVEKLIEISQLGSVFSICKSRDDAAALLS